MSTAFFKKKDPKKDIPGKATFIEGVALENGKQVWVDSPSGGEREQRFYSTGLKTEKNPWEQCFVKTVHELREIDLRTGRRQIHHVRGERIKPSGVLSFQEELDLAIVQERGKLPEEETILPPTEKTETVRSWVRRQLAAGVSGSPAYG